MGLKERNFDVCLKDKHWNKIWQFIVLICASVQYKAQATVKRHSSTFMWVSATESVANDSGADTKFSVTQSSLFNDWQQAWVSDSVIGLLSAHDTFAADGWSKKFKEMILVFDASCLQCCYMYCSCVSFWLWITCFSFVSCHSTANRLIHVI